MSITTKQADEALQKATVKSEALGLASNIVILDPYGYLKAFRRMDEAYLGSIDIALGKAKTAMLFRMNSEEVGAFLDPVQKTFGMVATNGGLVGFKGGMPIRSSDSIIGYIGVSGGSPEQDFEVALAGSRID